MSKWNSVWAVGALCSVLVAAPAALALDPDSDEEVGFERTPPRLAFVDGEVSFWRPGAEDWTPAQVNTPLAAGDELFTGDDANLELQVGAGGFVRAGENTQFGLTSLEPDYLQLRVTEGTLSLDLRSRKTGQTIEIGAPNAAFTVEQTGYYRVEVDGETTTFTSRRGGRATVTTASASSAAVAPSEQVVVTGTDAPEVETYAAPELDAWDRWNYERTDDQLDAVSARYVPRGVYGVDNLDHYGDWRLVSTYGPVWVPRGVPVGWVPYSAGRWLWDPYYGWTWVDDYPWGWAPYHYGRWVHVSGYWGWCPGRIVARPYYAPALVAFYGGGGFSIGVSFGYPSIGWVALGWGEPLLPWWGPVGFRHHPHWGGWGGPRYVNNVHITQKTVINVRDIKHYQNARIRDAIVAVDRGHFGRRSDGERHFTRANAERFSPLYGDHPAKPDRTSYTAAVGKARRPPREVRERSVVAVREPRFDRAAEPGAGRGARSSQAGATLPPTRVVQPAREEGGRISSSERPPFGRSGEKERRIAPPSPRFEDVRREEEARGRGEPSREQEATRSRVPSGPGAPEAPHGPKARPEPKARAERAPSPPSEPSRPSPRPEPSGGPSARGGKEPGLRGAPSSGRERVAPPTRELPGEPANRVYPQRIERSPGARQTAPRDVQAPLGGQGAAPREMPAPRGGQQAAPGGTPATRGGQPHPGGRGQVRGVQPQQGSTGGAGDAGAGGHGFPGRR